MSKASQEDLNEYGLPKTSVNIPMPEDTVKPREILDNSIEKAYYTLHLHLLKDSRIKKIEVNKDFAEKLQTENYKITKSFSDVNEMTIFGFPIKMKDMIDLYRIYDKNGNLLHRGILAKDQKIIDKMNELTKMTDEEKTLLADLRKKLKKIGKAGLRVVSVTPMHQSRYSAIFHGFGGVDEFFKCSTMIVETLEGDVFPVPINGNRDIQFIEDKE